MDKDKEKGKDYKDKDKEQESGAPKSSGSTPQPAPGPPVPPPPLRRHFVYSNVRRGAEVCVEVAVDGPRMQEMDPTSNVIVGMAALGLEGHVSNVTRAGDDFPAFRLEAHPRGMESTAEKERLAKVREEERCKTSAFGNCQALCRAVGTTPSIVAIIRPPRMAP